MVVEIKITTAILAAIFMRVLRAIEFSIFIKINNRDFKPQSQGISLSNMK